MEPIEPIHAKVIWTLVGGSNILDIFFDIDSSEMVVWWSIDFDSSWWYARDCFTPIIELTLFSIETLMLASQVRYLYSLISKFHEHICHCELCLCLIVLGCLDICLTIRLFLIKRMLSCMLYFYANFDFLW